MPVHIAETALKAPCAASLPRGADSALLAEIAAGLGAENDLAALLRRFLEPVVRLAGAQGGAVRVLGEEGDRLHTLAALGLPAGACGASDSVDRHCGHCGAATDGHRMVWAGDLDACASHSAQHFFGHDCQGLLAVPLQHRGRVLGVYNLFFAAAADEPDDGLMSVLRSVGDLLGLALNNARLEQEKLRARLASEREMMAAEVHDSVAQSLAFVKMRLPLLQDALAARDDARAGRYFEDLRCAVTQAHAGLRGIITHLRAPMHPDGLAQALELAAQHFRRCSDAELEVDNRLLPGPALSPEAESQLFHILQEALTNIARHARARHAWLRMGIRDDGLVECVVEDDGQGLPPPTACAGTHFGMDIMRERARRIAGALELGPRSGGGTRLRLVFPAQAGGAAMPAGSH